MDLHGPLRLLGGLHFLVRRGEADWEDVPGALAAHGRLLSDWVATQRVKTNEVQRCWFLLPCFLEASRRSGIDRFHLVELGPSGGLNLVWDRYGYEYAAGSWGGADASLRLRGAERAPVPAELLAAAPSVLSRIGVDVDPLDLGRDDDVELLKAFIWPGQEWRAELLDRAVAALRADQPEIVRGDLLDELPELLAGRPRDALTVVWQTSVFGYLSAQGRADARETIARAGKSGPPLAFVEATTPSDGSHDAYGLYVQVWPGGERIEPARADFHGAWLDWRAG